MDFYERTPVKAHCPACQSSDAKRLYQVDVEDSAQHFVRREVDPGRHDSLRAEILRLWGKPTCEVLRCDACDFCYAYPYVAGRDQFYGLFLSSPSFPRDRFEFHQTESALGKCLNPTSSLLEIGAGDGAFIKRITPALIPKDHVLCTEFSPAGAETIRQYGVQCEMIDVRELDLNKYAGHFSAVCMFQVLEHMDDLEKLWQSLTALTAAGAHLFISVPNAAAIEFHETHQGELDIPPNHVGRWNRRAFEAISGRHGWQVVEDAFEPATRGTLLYHLATSRYFQAREKSGSLTDRMTRINNRNLRRIFSIPVAASWFAASLPTALTTDPAKLGNTYWIHFRKP